jgi:ribosomal protein L11 methyltransferase
MNWTEVSVITDGEAAEAVAEALRPYAYDQSVVLEQLGDQTNLSPYAMEPHVTVKIYLSEQEDTPKKRRKLQEIVYFLGRLYPIPEPVFKILPEEDWANAWKAHYEPFRIGNRLWIQPSWQDAQNLNEDDIILTLDPGMAFGTGLHPTTQMCLQALEDLVKPGMRILDVGTGSGILAIAAAKLGAAYVLGIDTDEVAVISAQENVARNGVEKQVDVRRGGLNSVEEQGTWDLVVVNILAPVIIKLIEDHKLMNYPMSQGQSIFSGIIEDQAMLMKEAIEKKGGAIQSNYSIRDWIALVVNA